MEKFTTWDVCRLPSAPSRFSYSYKETTGCQRLNAPYLYVAAVAHSLRLAHRANEPVIDCTRSSYHFLLPGPSYVVIVTTYVAFLKMLRDAVNSCGTRHSSHRPPDTLLASHRVDRIPWCNVRHVCGNQPILGFTVWA